MTKAISPAKKELIKMSKEAKSIRKHMVDMAKTPEQALEAQLTTINQILMEMHQKATGQTEFKTFHDWKKAGFKVRKGEKSFRIWGKPRKCKKSVDVVKVDTGEETTKEKEFELFPMCCMFHRGQVEPLEKEPAPAPESQPVNKPVNVQEQKQEAAQEALAAIDMDCNPFVCADYADRIEAKSSRLQERAAKARQESNAVYQESKKMIDCIPMGQPILVGHHSESRDRNFRTRAWNKLGKSAELDKKADYLDRRSQTVGTGGIASDDPEALAKLKDKLANLEQSQETMKRVNRQYRAGGWEAVTDLNDQQLSELKSHMERFSYYRQPFESFSLSNNSAEIRRVKKRIQELETLYSMSPLEFESDDFAVGVEDGKIRIDFYRGKPSEETRKLLKTNAFKWSRHAGQWVRKATPNALYSTQGLIKELQGVDSIY